MTNRNLLTAAWEPGQYGLLLALHRCYGWRFYACAIPLILATGCDFAGPLVLNAFVNKADDGDADLESTWPLLLLLAMLWLQLLLRRGQCYRLLSTALLLHCYGSRQVPAA